MGTRFFGRARELASLRDSSKENGIVAITGAKGVGTTAILRQVTEDSGRFVSKEEHGGTEEGLLQVFGELFGVPVGRSLALEKRWRVFLRSFERTEVRHPRLLGIDELPPLSWLSLEELQRRFPDLRILVTFARLGGNEAEMFGKGRVVVPAFSILPEGESRRSEAAAFLLWMIRLRDPAWREGRSDSSIAEEIGELLEGNALLLSRVAEIAGAEGIAHALESVRRHEFIETQPNYLLKLRERLTARALGLVGYMGALPGPASKSLLEHCFEYIASETEGAGGFAEALRELVESDCLVQVGRNVLVSSELRVPLDRLDSCQQAAIIEQTARAAEKKYAIFEQSLERSFAESLEDFRVDQPILRWAALRAVEPKQKLLLSQPLAKWAIYAVEPDIERPLEELLGKPDQLPKEEEIDAKCALVDALRVTGKTDRAFGLANELLDTGLPRASAIARFTLARIAFLRGLKQEATLHLREAERLSDALRPSEQIRLAIGDGVLKMLSGNREDARKTLRAALRLAEDESLSHLRPEALAWSGINAIYDLELDEAEAHLDALDQSLGSYPSTYATMNGASFRALLEALRGDSKRAISSIRRSIAVARRSGFYLNEIDMMLERAMYELLGRDLGSHVRTLSELKLLASDWEAPPRVYRSIDNHVLASRYLSGEVSMEAFVAGVHPLPSDVGQKELFVLAVVLGSMDTVSSSDRRAIHSCFRAYEDLAEASDHRGRLLLLAHAARRESRRLGLVWPEFERFESGVLYLEMGGAMFLRDENRVDLSAKPQLQRVLAKLAMARVVRRGQEVSVEEISGFAWPGEKILATAAKNRVHVAIGKLRQLGLGRVLLSGKLGYYLDPAVPFRRVLELPAPSG